LIRDLQLVAEHKRPGAPQMVADALQILPPPQSHIARPSRIKKLLGRLKLSDPFRASSASVARGGEDTAIALEMPC
jgi:hypothetical protein